MSIEIISAISAAAVAIIGAIGAAVVGVVKQISDNRKPTQELIEVKDDIIELKKSQATINIMLCRRELTSIYHQYCKEKKITETDFETFMNIYTIYKSLGGNGIIETYLNEIKGFERI